MLSPGRETWQILKNATLAVALVLFYGCGLGTGALQALLSLSAWGLALGLCKLARSGRVAVRILSAKERLAKEMMQQLLCRLFYSVLVS